MKQVLIDTIPFNVSPQLIRESEERNGGRIIVTGVLQRAGAKNQNGRVYPKEILAREAKKYEQVEIAERRALGELDHPDSSVVNLANASHNINRIWWKENDLLGEVEILSTPSGNILKELLKANIRLGISSRGMGSVKQLSEDGTLEVQGDFELVCWDFVSNPSTHGAFMNPVNESVTMETVNTKYDRLNNIINEMLCDLTCKCSLPTRRK
tara:strand:- start:14342 stop:14974 length:633 start_codon:yes stop_codon:yes gene_type:complete